VRVLVAKNGEKSVQMCSVLASWGPTFGTRKNFSDSLNAKFGYAPVLCHQDRASLARVRAFLGRNVATKYQSSSKPALLRFS
jgi:hypothetical protein